MSPIIFSNVFESELANLLGFYRDYSHSSTGGYSFSVLKQESFTIFDTYPNTPSIHDEYFNRLAEFWYTQLINKKPDRLIDDFWRNILEITNEWINQDGANRVIHRGSLYYYWGVTSILNDDIDKGFLLMHQAFEEDVRINQPDSPAYKFITLDYQSQNQLFFSKVREIADYLDSKISQYNHMSSGAITLGDFRTKFLQNRNLTDTVFFCVYCIFRLHKIEKRIADDIKKSDFSALLELNVIFSLCQVAEIILKHLYPRVSMFGNLLHTDSNHGDYEIENVKHVRSELERNLNNTINSILNSSFSFPRNPISSNNEEDIGLTYALRNHTAHTITADRVIYLNFDKIVQRILNAIFFFVEKRPI